MTTFRVKVPSAKVNRVRNPVAGGSLGYSSTSAVVTRPMTASGPAYYVVPTATGSLDLTLAALPNTVQVATAWVSGGAPLSFVIGSTTVTPVAVEWEGIKTRYEGTFTAAQATGQTLWKIRTTASLYVYGVQVEDLRRTTQITGELDGGRGYGWKSTRHNSASWRAAQWRNSPVWSGGVISELDDGTNVICELAVGFGVHPVTPIFDEKARGGERVYRGSHPGARLCRLSLVFRGSNLPHLTEIRADVLSKIPVSGPFALLMDIGNTVQEGHFIYKDGMPGNFSGWTERTALEIEAIDPLFYDLSETSVALTNIATPTATYIAKRESGGWRGYSGGTTVRGPARVVYVAPDQTEYWGTESVGGTAYVQKWDGETVSDICSVTGSITAGPQINALASSPDGTVLYILGDYTTMNGTAGFGGVGKVTLSSGVKAKIPSAGTGCVGGGVLTGKVDPGGTYLVVGGTFTSINGVTASRFARMTLSSETWAAVAGAAFDAAVRDLACATNGDYYAVGSFGPSTGLAAPAAPSLTSSNVFLSHLPGGTYQYLLTYQTVVGETAAGTAAIITMTQTNFTTFDNQIALTFAAGGAGVTSKRLWRTDNLGSVFYLLATLSAAATSYTDNGVAALDKTQTPPTYNSSGHRTPRVARYDAVLGAWRNWGQSGMTGDVYCIDLFPDQQTAVVGGVMTACDGTACGGVAYIQGDVWLPLGLGVAGGAVNAIKRTASGRVWAGGLFTSADGNLLAVRLARFDGFPSGVWQHVDLIPSSTVYSIAARLPDELLIGHASTTTSAAAANTVTHTGTADWRPRLIADGPGTLRAIACYETGDELLLTHTLVANEQVVIDTATRTVVSNVMGDILYKLRPGGDLATFHLPSGASTLTVHMSGGGSVRVAGQAANVSVDKAAT